MLKHTIDSFSLKKFLTTYKNERHSIANDKQTRTALNRLMAIVPGHYEIIRYASFEPIQVRYNSK